MTTITAHVPINRLPRFAYLARLGELPLTVEIDADAEGWELYDAWPAGFGQLNLTDEELDAIRPDVEDALARLERQAELDAGESRGELLAMDRGQS